MPAKKKSSVQTPFLKWVGGKTQILEKVLSTFPKTIRTYHEPFLGGGSVLLGLLSKVKSGDIQCSAFHAYDINETLIHVYKNLQSYPNELIFELSQLVKDYSNITGEEINREASTLEQANTSKESYYYYIRKQYNGLSQSDKNTLIGSALFIFLNKTCFRGMYRVGPNGYNVPFGHYKTVSVYDEEELLTISRLIQPVVFECKDFSTVLSQSFVPDDFIYLDPPYAPETNKSFVGYTSDGFSLEKHQQLFELCHKSNTRLCLSNHYVTLVTESFKAPKYHTDVVVCKRSINSKNPGETTNEVLITTVC